MDVKTIGINSIHIDPANARKHGERNLDTIKGSLNAFGQQHPIVVDEKGTILSGNGRYLAMKSLGWTECNVVVSGLKGVDAKAYSIADNRTSELAEWDTGILAETLASLQTEDFDVDSIGYSSEEIDTLILSQNFEPVEQNEQPKLDQKSPVICPYCNKEFIPE